MIVIDHLLKRFRVGDDYRIVLNDLSFTSEDGEITGFIGHNGAGKTTALKIMTGAMRPSGGSVTLNGKDIIKDALEAKKQFGYVSDSPDHFLRLTAMEYLNFIADIYGVDEKRRRSFIAEYSERFDIASSMNQQIIGFSHGMRQKVMVMGALIHEPSIWILDEPLTGLDPQSAYELKNMMKEHAAKGNSVLFSTHVLEVAEALCDKIVIIRKGGKLFEGTLNEIRANYSSEKTLEEIFIELNKGSGYTEEELSPDNKETRHA